MDTPRLHTGKPRLCKRTPDLFPDDRRILSAVFEGKSDLVSYRHRKELVIRRLIYRACQKPDIFRAHLCHVPSIERDRPREPCFPRFQKPRDTLDERRFPAAGAPRDEDHLAFSERQIHMRKRILPARYVAARKIPDFQYHVPITCFKRLPMRYPIQLPSVLYKRPFISM